MKILEFRKTNHRAVAGFLLPFLAAAVSGLLLLFAEDAKSLRFSLPYMTIVPLILIAGLVMSLRSIPFIDELGDRDYAYAGLTLNFIFLFFYVTSLIHFFS